VTRRTCRISGCGRAISDAMLMCYEHWMMVPRTLRRDIMWRTWGRAATDRPSYARAVREAVLHVEALLARAAGLA